MTANRVISRTLRDITKISHLHTLHVYGEIGPTPAHTYVQCEIQYNIDRWFEPVKVNFGRKALKAVAYLGVEQASSGAVF